MDDWILATFNIPSVTGELGNESEFIDEWTIKDSDKAFKILIDNNPWVEHTYHKIGSQLALDPVKYEKSDLKNKLILNNTTPSAPVKQPEPTPKEALSQ